MSYTSRALEVRATKIWTLDFAFPVSLVPKSNDRTFPLARTTKSGAKKSGRMTSSGLGSPSSNVFFGFGYRGSYFLLPLLLLFPLTSSQFFFSDLFLSADSKHFNGAFVRLHSKIRLIGVK